MAWVLLAASAAAILVVGLIATILIFGEFTGAWTPIPAAFWSALAGACLLTVISLTVRSLRWVFLLRRAGTRIPIRDAYIGYFAGLSLLLTPFLLGEIAVRALVQRTRARVPVATTILVNLWDRLLDLVALAVITAVFGMISGRVSAGAGAWLLAVAGLSLVGGVRRLLLAGASWIAGSVASRVDGRPADVATLAALPDWIAALTASVAAWLLPGMALWALAVASGCGYRVVDAQYVYALSAGVGGLVLAPGGVIVTGRALLEALGAAGCPAAIAAITVLGTRLATAGIATALGAVFLLVHLRSRTAASPHFDAIADVYDVQLPESRRLALLARKTEMMRDVLAARGQRPESLVGLDVGCGQGQHVGRMRELGFDVSGIDVSPAQVDIAARKLGSADLVRPGSVMQIPARAAAYDFVYVVNVLHHLESVDEQRRAVAELLRVLRPGGTLFIHEINTRNILFRFYMGYVYPSLNCIDEGVERWLLPHRLATYTDAPVDEVRYFTFLPEFLPASIVRLLTPIERLLEASPLRAYSAHYLAVLHKA